jgi:hypothetical protein
LYALFGRGSNPIVSELAENGDYEKALKTLYLKTDEDLRAGKRFLVTLVEREMDWFDSAAFLRPQLFPRSFGLYRRLGSAHSRWTDHCRKQNASFKVHVLAPQADVSRFGPQANSGDSRSVLSDKGYGKPMSHDHKPTNGPENERITAAGGFVEFGRVNGERRAVHQSMRRQDWSDILSAGNLALSRALGDFEFKQNYGLEPEKQIVTADPDILTHKVDGEEEFLVLACDGELVAIGLTKESSTLTVVMV